MNELQNFNFSGQDVRIITINDDPWFIAKDVADILEYSDTQAMTRRLDDEDKETYTDKSSGQGRNVAIINESGLYTAILGSKKTEAKRFKRWITSEVLPTIRKHGAYNAKVPTTQRELVQLALSANEETNQRIDVIENKIHDIEENKLITTEDKGTIDSHVRKKVYQICKDLRLSQEAKSMLFKDLGSSIKQLFNVPNRGRIKDKDFMSALEFVESWEPSSVTKAKINQLSLFDRGIAS
jgi:prophage antirepressor-like protein